jgi:hypothetical protein
VISFIPDSSGTSFFNKFFQSNIVDVKIEYDAQNLKA